MRFRPSDALLFACLGASFAAMIFAFRGELPLAGWLFLGAYAADALHALVAPAPAAHRFGAELRDVIGLVAFAAAPALLVFVSLRQAGVALWLAAAVGATPLVTGSVRMALHAVRPRGEGLWAVGLPRAQSALFAVALCRSSCFESSSLRGLLLALLPLVAVLNVVPWRFARAFVAPVDARKGLVWAAALASTAAAFAAGLGFDVLAGWVLAAALLRARPLAHSLLPADERRA